MQQACQQSSYIHREAQEGRDFQMAVSSPSQKVSKQSVRPDEGFPIQMGGKGEMEGGLKTSVFLSFLKVGAPMTYRTKCFIYLLRILVLVI